MEIAVQWVCVDSVAELTVIWCFKSVTAHHVRSLLTTRVSAQLPFQWVFDSMFIPCWFTSCSDGFSELPQWRICQNNLNWSLWLHPNILPYYTILIRRQFTMSGFKVLIHYIRWKIPWCLTTSGTIQNLHLMVSLLFHEAAREELWMAMKQHIWCCRSHDNDNMTNMSRL